MGLWVVTNDKSKMAIIEQDVKVKKLSPRGIDKEDTKYILKRMIPFIPVLIIVGVVLWYFSYETISIEDYVSVKYIGYDGKGTAVVSLDSEGPYEAFLKEVTLSTDVTPESLSNGDVFTISFEYEKDFAKENNLRISEDEMEATVEGLPESKPLTEDLVFKGLNIETKGISPEMHVLISNESTEPFFSGILYDIPGKTEEDWYRSGEEVVVRAYVSKESAMEYKYAIEGLGVYETTYTIPSGEEYVRNSADITDSIISELDEYAKTLFGEASEYGLRIFSEANLMPLWVGGKTTFKWKNPRLISAYFAALREENFGSREYHDNDIKFVYETTLTQADGISCIAEVVVQFTDLTKKDGILDLKKDSGKITAASYRNSNIAALVRGSDDNVYIVEKLK